MPVPNLPPRLAELVEDFTGLGVSDRLQLLAEISEELPALPARYVGHREAMEQVHECQTPLFLAAEVDDLGRVHLFFDAPPEAPTTRGFASIMYSGLDGESTDTVLGVPNDFYTSLGLGEAVSPLRLRGMVAILTRIKNQVRAAATV
ncbi:MAG: SufE family protein [Actinomycetota bacterium]|nr:SufE family protein [Actinomycetota bacterium]